MDAQLLMMSTTPCCQDDIIISVLTTPGQWNSILSRISHHENQQQPEV